MSFRLGVVPYLNPLPLYFTLRERSDIEIFADFPANLGARLMRGECDAALMPVADHLRGIGDGLLGDGIVGATQEVRSVMLFSKVPIKEITSVALDTSSHSSVALIQVLLRDFYDLCPTVTLQPPILGQMLDQADAAVLIGDPALKAFQSPGSLHVYDMAGLWHRFTGLSFVFAAWTARPGLERREELVEVLNHARDEGETRVAEIVAANPIGTSLPDPIVHDYLENVIQYRLTPAHRAGMEQFGQRLKGIPAV
jgi:chorismate dehydratase